MAKVPDVFTGAFCKIPIPKRLHNPMCRDQLVYQDKKVIIDNTAIQLLDQYNTIVLFKCINPINLWAIRTQGHMLRVDIFDRNKYQIPFGIDQMSLSTLQTGPNVLQRVKHCFWMCQFRARLASELVSWVKTMTLTNARGLHPTHKCLSRTKMQGKGVCSLQLGHSSSAFRHWCF